MAIRIAEATWYGSLIEGSGAIKLSSNLLATATYSYNSRFKDENGLNPEELLGAALAMCYSMSVAAELSKRKYDCKILRVIADVDLKKSGEEYVIPLIELQAQAEIPSISKEEFRDVCEKAKEHCPVAKVYTGTDIKLIAQLTPT